MGVSVRHLLPRSRRQWRYRKSQLVAQHIRSSDRAASGWLAGAQVALTYSVCAAASQNRKSAAIETRSSQKFRTSDRRRECDGSVGTYVLLESMSNRSKPVFSILI